MATTNTASQSPCLNGVRVLQLTIAVSCKRMKALTMSIGEENCGGEDGDDVDSQEGKYKPARRMKEIDVTRYVLPRLIS